MGTPREPKPAKYFVAVLSSEVDHFADVERDLTATLSKIDGRSEILPWTVSKFYEKEMGPSLLRRFFSVANLASPQQLAAVKLKTHAIESRYRVASSSARRVNLDPGYLDTHKVVLASTKNAGQRIYLGSGIYAEATLFFYNGGFHGLPYTYADYLWPQAREFFTRMRAIYLDQLKPLA